MVDSNRIKRVMKNIKWKDITTVRKSSLITLRIAPGDKKRLERTAAALEMSLSEFLIQTGLYAADRLENEAKK